MINCFKQLIIIYLRLCFLFFINYFSKTLVESLFFREKVFTFALPLCVAMLVFKEEEEGSSLRREVAGIQGGG